MVCLYLVPAEDEAVDRFGIEYRLVERLEEIIFYHNATMEVLLLMRQIRYFRINRNHGIRELEHIRERVYKVILPDKHLMASARLVPTIAIAAEQDGCTRSVVE